MNRQRLVYLCWIGLMLLSLESYAIDTYQFKNEANQTRALTLARSLRCPQCQNQNLMDSNSPIAKDLRHQVYRMVDQNATDDAIIAFMVQRYGDFVLYRPALAGKTVLLWSAPALLMLLAIVLFWMVIKSRAASPLQQTLTAEQQAELQRLLTEINQQPSTRQFDD
jgi:cytochrome c nitrite reductase accessory protein NrfF